MEQKRQNSGDEDTEGGNNIAFRATYNELVGVIEVVMGTFQVSQQALVRLLLTLSSGSLLASISLLRSWVNADTVWLSLLPVAWGFFGISIFSCLLHYGGFLGYRWIGPALKNFINEAEELTEGSRLSASDRAAAAIKIRLDQLGDKSFTKGNERKVGVAMVSFLLGFLVLTVFATRNLPWSP